MSLIQHFQCFGSEINRNVFVPGNIFISRKSVASCDECDEDEGVTTSVVYKIGKLPPLFVCCFFLLTFLSCTQCQMVTFMSSSLLYVLFSRWPRPCDESEQPTSGGGWQQIPGQWSFTRGLSSYYYYYHYHHYHLTTASNFEYGVIDVLIFFCICLVFPVGLQ